MKRLFLAFLSILIAFFGVFVSPNFVYASESSAYTSALDDLQLDSSFDISNYPQISDDYSLHLITISESVDKELFVYVYQPCGNSRVLNATSINISQDTDFDLSFHNYNLSLISKNGTICKYKVLNFTFRDSLKRFYAISSIFRLYNKYLDSPSDYDNSIDEVAFAVNKQFCFSSEEDDVYSSVVDIETIEITDKFVGYVEYPDGFYLYAAGSIDSYFVAFSTDKSIDKLLEADVCYVQQVYTEAGSLFPEKNFSEKEKKECYLKCDDIASVSGNGLFAPSFTWNRIERATDFLNNCGSSKVYSGAVFDVSYGVKLTDEARSAIEKQDWVLRFAETQFFSTSYSSEIGIGYSTLERTFVGEVTILRLKFVTEGVTYNLGVIDNKQTGSTKPVNSGGSYKIAFNPKTELLDNFLSIILGALFVVAIIWVITKVIPVLSSVRRGASLRRIERTLKKQEKERGKK